MTGEPAPGWFEQAWLEKKSGFITCVDDEGRRWHVDVRPANESVADRVLDGLEEP